MTRHKKVKKSARLSITRRGFHLGIALALIFTLLLPAVFPGHGQAALLSARELELSSSANGNISTDANGNDVCNGTDNGGCGAEAKHTVSFTLATAANFGSILLMYCTSPIMQDACTTPTGLDAQALTSATVTCSPACAGFSLDETTGNSTINATAGVNPRGNCNDESGANTGTNTYRQNCVPLSRTAAAATAGTTVTVVYGGGNGSNFIKNPTSDNYSFYARILTFSDNAYTTIVDEGGTAAATAQQIDITARVKETLNFSVGRAPTSKVDDATCTPFSDDGAITLGDADGVLSPTIAYDKHSFFRINTNTVNGTIVYYSGDTLKTSGGSPQDITAIGGTATASDVGAEQFGLAFNVGYDPPEVGGNLDAHELSELTTLDVDYDGGAGTITDGGTAQFAFEVASMTVPVEIARSTGGIGCDTGALRYIANISTSTAAGIYRTTITYIATGTY